ncbi:BTB/POZ domain-containing protein KCTD7-like [Haliotis rufescens]|uniref:BTB/POZ domain-containing protein KCTD7-like n=1 Tax=Haliotis rufescens TaxID=6454 RepID=UPI00201F144E|nr:BTB/POZ domain-containing protein KCTD7-like [Haliotis rufescens]
MTDEDDSSVEEIISIREIAPRPVPRAKHPFITHVREGYEQSHTDSMRRQPGARSLPSSPHTGVNHISPRDNVVKLGQFPPIISLNVGGMVYQTRLSTLLKYSDSMLAAMFSGRHKVDQDKDGHYFLDTNGAVFGHILEYLRYGTVPPSDLSTAVYRDAEYYGLHSMVEKLQLRPEIASIIVKESHRSQFPGYQDAKHDVIRAAVANASINRIGEVLVCAFRTEFKAKVQNFNPLHGCIVESAHVSIGPWETQADEEVFMKCLENDLMEDGFNVKPHEGKRKCKYYYGQTCQKFVYKLQIIFD